MNASLAQRNGYQVKCDELNLAQLSGRLEWRRRRRRKKAVSPSEKDEKTRSNRFLEAKPKPKSRTYVADRTPAKEPNLWKREGEALTSLGSPLTDLTTVKLSRKRCPKTSGRTCVESMLCKVHPEPYIPPLPWPNPQTMHLTCTILRGWVCCADLNWSSHGWQSVGWSDLVVWSDDSLMWELVHGLICGRMRDSVWLSVVVVWSGADLMACRCGLVPRPNLKDWPRKMVCSDGWKLKTWEAEVTVVKRL